MALLIKKSSTMGREVNTAVSHRPPNKLHSQQFIKELEKTTMTCDTLCPNLPGVDTSQAATPPQLQLRRLSSASRTEEIHPTPTCIGRRDYFIETAKVAVSIIVVIGLVFALINIGLLQVRVGEIERKAEEVKMYPAGKPAQLTADNEGRSAAAISLNVVRPLYSALNKVRTAANEGSEAAAAYLTGTNRRPY